MSTISVRSSPTALRPVAPAAAGAPPRGPPPPPRPPPAPPAGPEPLARRGQRVGRADELLHGAVVQIGGDPAALEVGRVERALQERLALLVAPAHTARQAPRERELDQREDDERAEQRRREVGEQVAPGGRHRAVALVGLEEER